MMINLGTNPLSPSPCTDGTSATIAVRTPALPAGHSQVRSTPLVQGPLFA
jgi:hypothetical protein